MTQAPEGLVVDASVAVKWLLTDEEYADQAARLLTAFEDGRLSFVAPEHIRYEVPSAITVATRGRRPRLTEEQGREAIEEFLALGIRLVGDDDLVRAAYPLARRSGCAFYDALYLTLAERLRLPFLTADRRLYERVRQLPHVRWIKDYAPAGG